MNTFIHKTLALTLSASLLAAYTPGFATSRVVNPDDSTTLSGETWDGLRAGNGAAIFAGTVGNSLTVTDSTFSNNTAHYDNQGFGGAIFTQGDLSIQADFNDNQASEGGAILNYPNGNLTIENSSFTNNTATGESTDTKGKAYGWGGGAIFNFGSATISNTSFTNNTAKYFGAIGTSTTAPLTITNSSFQDNSALGGGAIGNFYKGTITNSTFTNNKATSTDIDNGGGALFIGSVSQTVIEESTFTGNESATSGGAITTRAVDPTRQRNNSGATLDITNSTFTGNIAATTGGVLDNYFYNSQNEADAVYIADSTFENNSAADGGVVYNHAETDSKGNSAALFIKDSTFTGNTASGNGGAIYNASTLTLAGTNTFSGNTAAEGADIYNTGTLNIKDTTTIDGGIAGTGDINVDGTLNIGQAIVETGTLAFAKGSTLGVEFGNDTMGNIKANEVTIEDGSNLQVVLSKDFLTTDKTSHDLINKDATVNGEFALADVANALYDVSLADNVVTAQRKSADEQEETIKQSGGTANDAAVTAAYTSASDLGNDTTNQVADIINTLAQTDTAALVKVTKAVAPEVAPAKQVVHTAVLNEVFGALQHRMADASAGAPSMYALSDGKDYHKTHTKHFSVWTQGLLNKSHKEATAATDAFTGRSTGVAAGADMKVGESGLAGIGYAYTHTNVSSAARHDRILGDTFFLYGQYRPSAFYVQGSLAYGDSKYEETKYLPGMTLDADFHVQHYAAQGRMGYDVTDWFSPSFGLRYTRLHQEGYTDGAQQVAADNADYFTGMLGADFQLEKRLSSRVSLLPHLYTGVAYDFVSDDNDSRVTLPNNTGYMVNGERLHRLSFEVGAGVTARLFNSVEAVVAYEGSFREDYNSHTGTLKLRYLF